MRARAIAIFLVGATSAGLLLHCVTDERADQSVTVIDSCDLARLATSPTDPQASVRVYVEAAEGLAAKTADVETMFRDACNAVNRELGLATGGDATAACQPLAARVADVLKAAPQIPGPTPTVWFTTGFPASCKADPAEKVRCIASCAGDCDARKCSPPEKVVGRCTGRCSGTCSVTGTTSCNGQCQGECKSATPNACVGECIGKCAAPTFMGVCDVGCWRGFNGDCGGTCTGTCNGAPINGGGPSDAGSDAAPSDAAASDAATDASSGDAAPPPPPPPPQTDPTQPPANADGNCVGRCIGVCSSTASGMCGDRCRGDFSGGTCNGACTGSCISGAGTGCVAECTGACTSPSTEGTACDGTCRGGCSADYQDAVCEGALDCKQNVECGNACEVKSALTATCSTPERFEVQAISDPKLYAALKKHGGALGAAIAQRDLLRTALGFVADRTPSDFETIHAKGDLVRACVARGTVAVKKADNSLRVAIAADPVRKK
jgi:hypothetical protein